jgi:hypothetical protein
VARVRGLVRPRMFSASYQRARSDAATRTRNAASWLNVWLRPISELLSTNMAPNENGAMLILKARSIVFECSIALDARSFAPTDRVFHHRRIEFIRFVCEM